LASKKSLNPKNLEELGASRLAELLIEISAGNAAAKRRLRLELAGAQSPAEVAREVDKRLSTIRRSRSLVDWPNRRALVEDLNTQRRVIVEKVAKSDPDDGLALMWRFLGLADSIFERCDDSSGTVISIFHEAVYELAEIASRASIEPAQLADAVFEALQQNHYGQYDDLLPALAPVLGKSGLLHLKSRVMAWSQQPLTKSADDERVPIAWSNSGPTYQDEIDVRARESMVHLALIEIADALGDVDGFIAQYDAKTRKVPGIAAEIARRLLEAGRAEEALGILDEAKQRTDARLEYDWENARIAVLMALGREQETQDMRWSCFERSLSNQHLREYLKRLPDFDDVDAENRAFEYAASYQSILSALTFFVTWPAVDRAASLVMYRANELNGDHYEYLTPAANALSAKYPLAASLVLRAMIDFTLTHSRSSRYKHAARHLLECSSLSRQITDFGELETHDAYEARLRKVHGRKSGFWSLVD
jgi:hypothetical protein